MKRFGCWSMEWEWIHYVYCIFKNNKPIYIGQTGDLKYRINTHKKRFGKDITFIILDTHKSERFGYNWETFWIHQFVTWGFDLENMSCNYKNRTFNKTTSSFIKYIKNKQLTKDL